MGTISTEAQKVQWDVGQGLQGIFNTAKGWFDQVIGGARAVAGGILQGDVVGINGEHVPQMKAAVQRYIDGLNEHLKRVQVEADTSQAFKGDYAKAITDFVNAVCEACGCIISNLLIFNEKLEEVYQAYLAKDAELAANVTGQAGELNSQFTRYGGGS